MFAKNKPTRELGKPSGLGSERQLGCAYTAQHPWGKPLRCFPEQPGRASHYQVQLTASLPSKQNKPINLCCIYPEKRLMSRRKHRPPDCSRDPHPPARQGSSAPQPGPGSTF